MPLLHAYGNNPPGFRNTVSATRDGEGDATTFFGALATAPRAGAIVRRDTAAGDAAPPDEDADPDSPGII